MISIEIIVASVIIAITCPLVGIFLVLRRYSLLGDSITHMAFGGIALGVIMNVYPLWTAFIASTLSALGITRLRLISKVSGDATIAAFLPLGFALGLLFLDIADIEEEEHVLEGFLFGDIYSIDPYRLLIISIVSIIAIAITILLKKELLYIAFDEEQARIDGIDVNVISYIQMITASIVIVASIYLAGVLLIPALLVLPNIASMMLGRGFRDTLIISLAFSLLSVTLGLIIASIIAITPSAVIALISASILFITLLIKRSKVEVQTLR